MVKMLLVKSCQGFAVTTRNTYKTLGDTKKGGPNM